MKKAKIAITITKVVDLENKTVDELIQSIYDDPYEFLVDGGAEVEIFGRTKMQN